jgi:phage terminase large subunit-like protein
VSAGLERYARDPIAFLDDLVTVNELGERFRLVEHQREILRVAFVFDADGKLGWDTLVYSCPKKSGKTATNAALVVWWAFTQEPPNELLIVANDFEQAQARVFSTAARLIQRNAALAASATIQSERILLSNGTEIRAIASEYAGAAGPNQGLTSWDELWGYTSEASRRLFEELTPVLTRRNSIRLVTTYAGFENESTLLRELYLAGVGGDEHADGRGVRLHPTLPLYVNAEARQVTYWDHERRMPWQQAPAYYLSQKRTLRGGTFLRLHENHWTTASSTFLTPELWDACEDDALRPLLPTWEHRVFVGVDAGIKHDTAAVVGVRWDGAQLALAMHRIWRPSVEAALDLEATIEAFLREAHARYRLERVLVDPYQLHRSITTLKAAGLPIEEYAQTTANTTRMGQALFDLLNGRNLRLYASSELREQALNTVAVESPRGWRLAKERASRKIDAIVALAMACVAAMEAVPRGPHDYGISVGDSDFAEPPAAVGPWRPADQEPSRRTLEGWVGPECRYCGGRHRGEIAGDRELERELGEGPTCTRCQARHHREAACATPA